ncbi:hypothetical protein Tco_0833276 [Tanacetum coccineum]
MVESEKPKKKKDQIEYDVDVAQRLQAELDSLVSRLVVGYVLPVDRLLVLLLHQVEVDSLSLSFFSFLEMKKPGLKDKEKKKLAKEQGEISIEERSKLFVELMKERKKHFARLKAEEQTRKPLTKAQKSNRAVSELAVGSSKGDAEEELNQESSKRQKTNESSELAKEPRDKEADELSQEELQQMMIIVLEQGMNVEALQTKYLIIDWEIYTEGTRKYWKIIRVGNHTKVHHFFDDMLKAFDRDDLVMLWILVKEKFNSTEPTDDKEREIWVELKRLFEPDTDDELWKLQKHIHDLT